LELPLETRNVRKAPLFGNLAVGEAEDGNFGDCDAAFCRRYPLELAPMGPRGAKARNDAIALRNDVLDIFAPIWESTTETCHVLLDALATPPLRTHQEVAHEVCTVEFIDCSEIPLAKDTVMYTSNHVLILEQLMIIPRAAR